MMKENLDGRYLKNKYQTMILNILCLQDGLGDVYDEAEQCKEGRESSEGDS